MLRFLLACCFLAMSQDPPTPAEGPPGPARAGIRAAEAESLAKYNAMVEKPPANASDHWKVAIWCEQNGLRPEAYFHFGKVIELDPRRDAAWQKLGFRKVDGRWMTAEQVAAEALQKKADKEWSAKLKRWHKEVHGGKKRVETLAALDEVTDPAAVPSLYREFCGGGGTDQEIALGPLGQIQGPVATKVIAILALYGKTATVRRHATELLRGRPSDDYVALLVSFMKNQLRYEVRPVGGPGSPGILFVEGDRFNVRRFYAPPAPGFVSPRPGDMVTYDSNGFPVVSRSFTSFHLNSTVGVPGSKTLATQTDRTTITTESFSYATAMIEAQRSALTAKAQLDADVAQVDAVNEGIRQFNELVMTVAQAATGKSPGRTAKEWRDWLASGKDGRYPRPTRERPKPTIDENVPLAYLPDLAAAVTSQSQTRFISQTIVDT